MKYLLTTIKTFSLPAILLLFTGCAAKKELANLKQNYKTQEEKLTQQNQQRIWLTEERINCLKVILL